MLLRRTLIATAPLGAFTLAGAQSKGVTDPERVLGLITDLSGPVVNNGKESRNGMNMAVDEINAKGGIQGRKTMSASTIDHMMKKTAYARVGVIEQDDDGREAFETFEGVEAYLKAKGTPLVKKTSYKRGATDFSSQMTKLKAADCDLVFNASTCANSSARSARPARSVPTPTFSAPLPTTMVGKARPSSRFPVRTTRARQCATGLNYVARWKAAMLYSADLDEALVFPVFIRARSRRSTG